MSWIWNVVLAVAAATPAAAASPNAAPATPPDAAQRLELRNLILVDGRGGPPRSGVTVEIQDGRVVRIGREEERSAAGVRVHDLGGRWVIPGLIDAHVHVATDPGGRDADARERLARAFRGGVTAVRDMGGDAIALDSLARWAADPGVAAPRVHYSAVFAGPSFFVDPRTVASAHGGVPGKLPWLHAVTGEDDLPAAVAAAKAAGATGVKIYADLPAERVAAVAAEARRQGLRAWSHATVYPARPSEAAAAGVHVLSHAMYLVWEAGRPVPATYHLGREALRALPAPAVDTTALTALFAVLRERDVMLEPTLLVTTRQPALQAIASWCGAATGLAHRAGVRIVAGTDDVMTEGDSLPNLHRELELLVRSAGLTPLEALTAATRHAAEALGIGETHGTVETGRVADLVVLDADPAMDIANTRKVWAVFKEGRRFGPP